VTDRAAPAEEPATECPEPSFKMLSEGSSAYLSLDRRFEDVSDAVRRIWRRMWEVRSEELGAAIIVDRAAGAPEIDVTPAMIEAGRLTLFEWADSLVSAECMAAVYTAMARVSSRSDSDTAPKPLKSVTPKRKKAQRKKKAK
jgi:hypothetical protein